MKKKSAVITVFFSLLSVIFLSLTFTVVEAVRFRAARAHSADITAAGNWSLFSEYENRLLEDYDIFAFDGSYGDGKATLESINERFRSYVEENTSVNSHLSDMLPENSVTSFLPGYGTDPFKVSAEDTNVSGYALLTDDNGEYFYQQVVSYMWHSGIVNIIGEIKNEIELTDKLKEKIDNFKKEELSRTNLIGKLKDFMKGGFSAILKRRNSSAEGASSDPSQSTSSGSNEVFVPDPADVDILDSSGNVIKSGSASSSSSSQTAPVPASGPSSASSSGSSSLPAASGQGNEEIEGFTLQDVWGVFTFIRGALTLGLWNEPEQVCGNLNISKKRINTFNLLSHRLFRNKGNLPLETKYGGFIDNIFFREYLMSHFGYYGKVKGDRSLDYGVEYMINGNASDRKNLCAILRILMVLRQADNIIVLETTPTLDMETEKFAAPLKIVPYLGQVVALPVEVVVKIMNLFWVYGESLYDMRILMNGGKLPLHKNPAQWHVHFKDLLKIQELLKTATPEKSMVSFGFHYPTFIRIIMNLEFKKTHKKRALDLIEQDLRKQDGMEGFRADNCVVAVKDSATYKVKPVYSFLPNAVLGSKFDPGSFRMESGFSYQ